MLDELSPQNWLTVPAIVSGTRAYLIPYGPEALAQQVRGAAQSPLSPTPEALERFSVGRAQHFEPFIRSNPVTTKHV